MLLVYENTFISKMKIKNSFLFKPFFRT